MPSPFPGMDPYLEGTDYWRGFHGSMLHLIMENLQPCLLPKYAAVIEARLTLSALDQPDAEPRSQLRLPDVAIRRRPPAPPRPDGGSVLVAEPPALAETEPLWVDEPDLHLYHLYLTIRSLPDQQIVTVIELLSPTNKLLGDGRDQYRRKQRELLLTNTSLVEIDLLRGGAHTVAFREGSVAPSDYRICVYRGYFASGFAVIPFGIRDPLPRPAIPLRHDDPDVVLDLPTVFTRVYDTAAYSVLLDYGRPTEPTLPAADAAWAEEQRRAASGSETPDG